MDPDLFDDNSNPWDPEFQQYFQSQDADLFQENSNPPDFNQVQAAVAVGGVTLTVLSLVPGFNVALYVVGAVAAGYGIVETYNKTVAQETEKYMPKQPQSARRHPFKNYEPKKEEPTKTYTKTKVKKKGAGFLLFLPLLIIPPIIFRRRRKGNR